MSIRPTENGGRVVYGNTPWGNYRAVCDADGKLLDWAMNVCTPEASEPQDPDGWLGPGDAIYWAGVLCLGLGPLYERWSRRRGRPCRCRNKRRTLNTLGWSGSAKALIRKLTPRKRVTHAP